MIQDTVNELKVVEQINLLGAIASVILAIGMGISAARVLLYGNHVYSLINMIFGLSLTAIVIVLAVIIHRKGKSIRLPLSSIFLARRKLIPGEESYMETAYNQSIFNSWLFTLIVEMLFIGVSRIKIFPGTFYGCITLSLMFGIFGISYLIIYFRSEKLNSVENAHE